MTSFERANEKRTGLRSWESSSGFKADFENAQRENHILHRNGHAIGRLFDNLIEARFFCECETLTELGQCRGSENC